MKATTLCFIVKEGRVLLAMKKRGFGQGKWNGPGGKVEKGESSEEACRREVKEEIGVKIDQIQSLGWVDFYFDQHPEWDNHCEIFIAQNLQGEPQESEEMLPRWFEIPEIPWDSMWEDDRYWLPNVLAGKRVEREFYFDSSGQLLREKSLIN